MAHGRILPSADWRLSSFAATSRCLSWPLILLERNASSVPTTSLCSQNRCSGFRCSLSDRCVSVSFSPSINHSSPANILLAFACRRRHSVHFGPGSVVVVVSSSSWFSQFLFGQCPRAPSSASRSSASPAASGPRCACPRKR